MSTMSSPIYIQIHNQIKQANEAGRWVVGDRIPSERVPASQCLSLLNIWRGWRTPLSKWCRGPANFIKDF